MDISNSENWPPYLPDQNAVNAFREKIAEEMEELSVKINEISKEPFNNEDIWATVGNLRYGHPTTPLILRYKALMWFHLHPPDPRGEPMFSRPGPYTVYVRREDMADILPFDIRTIDRMLAVVREKSNIRPYGKITVELFCFLHNLPEDKIQQQLHDLALKRLKKHKQKSE